MEQAPTTARSCLAWEISLQAAAAKPFFTAEKRRVKVTQCACYFPPQCLPFFSQKGICFVGMQKIPSCHTTVTTAGSYRLLQATRSTGSKMR